MLNSIDVQPADTAADPEFRCAVCDAPAISRPDSPGPTWTLVQPPPSDGLPAVVLCESHWSQLSTDWLILGWCVDHYGEALCHCEIHDQEIQPI